MLFDAIQRLFMPVEVKQEWDNNISISVTGDPTRGQDFDFILEEINREIKQFLPIDTSPNDTTWINVCRNKDVLKNVITSLESELGIQSGTYLKTLKLSNAVNVFRLKFRRYLASSPDDNYQRHTSSRQLLEHQAGMLWKEDQLDQIPCSGNRGQHIGYTNTPGVNNWRRVWEI